MRHMLKYFLFEPVFSIIVAILMAWGLALLMKIKFQWRNAFGIWLVKISFISMLADVVGVASAAWQSNEVDALKYIERMMQAERDLSGQKGKDGQNGENGGNGDNALGHEGKGSHALNATSGQSNDPANDER